MGTLRRYAITFAVGSLGLLSACGGLPSQLNHAQRQAEVAARERAFAETMAQRDARAFGDFIAPDAVFFSGDKALRGKDEVLAAWTRHFVVARAPFSWHPDSVEVLGTGGLAMTSGPVFDTAGNKIARFHSIWRLDPDGKWRVVFDRGEQLCQCATQ